MISLPTKYGGLGIPIVQNIAKTEYLNSVKFTKRLTDQIINSNNEATNESNAKIKANIKKQRQELYKTTLANLRTHMSDQDKKTNDLNQNQISGSYNWIQALPLKEFDYKLNKQQFWDALRIRYNWQLPNLPSECVCGADYNVQHALSCKKGGFITLRHNDIRDKTAEFIEEVCKDVRKEPRLLPLTGEKLSSSTHQMSVLNQDLI